MEDKVPYNFFDNTHIDFKVTRISNDAYVYVVIKKQIRNLDPVYTCPICMRVYLRKYNVERHMIDVHQSTVNGKRYNYQCKFCFRGYARERNLKRHMKIHI